MEIFRELKKLGYKHYLPYTIKELDNLSINSDEFLIESELTFKFFRDKYKLHCWIDTQDGFFTFYNYTILNRLESNSNKFYTKSKINTFGTYEQARLECLKELIKIVKDEK